MKKIIIVIMCICFLTTIVIAVPETINEQGVLRNATNNTILDGSYNFNLTIYNGTDDATIYSNTQLIKLNSGVYDIMWHALKPVWFYNDNNYFKLKIENTSQMDRINFTSVPYAFVAEFARNVSCSDITGGTDTDFCSDTSTTGITNGSDVNFTKLIVAKETFNVTDGGINASGNVYIGDTSMTLKVTDPGSFLVLDDNGNIIFSISYGGISGSLVQSGDWNPLADAIYNFGTDTGMFPFRWRNWALVGNISDGTNKIIMGNPINILSGLSVNGVLNATQSLNINDTFNVSAGGVNLSRDLVVTGTLNSSFNCNKITGGTDDFCVDATSATDYWTANITSHNVTLTELLSNVSGINATDYWSVNISSHNGTLGNMVTNKSSVNFSDMNINDRFNVSDGGVNMSENLVVGGGAFGVYNNSIGIGTATPTTTLSIFGGICLDDDDTCKAVGNGDFVIQDGGMCIAQDGECLVIPADGDLKLEDGALNVCVDGCTATSEDGVIATDFSIAIDADGNVGNIGKSGFLIVGDGSDSGAHGIEIEDGSMCIGDGGCTAPSTDGWLRFGSTGDGIEFVDANTRIYESGDDIYVETDDDLFINPDDDINIGTTYTTHQITWKAFWHVGTESSRNTYYVSSGLATSFDCDAFCPTQSSQVCDSADDVTTLLTATTVCGSTNTNDKYCECAPAP